MNFDKLNTSKVEKQSGVKKWFKKNAALAGVVGLGYLGGLNNAQAQEQKQSPEGGKTNITHVEESKTVNTNEVRIIKFVTESKGALKKVLLDLSGEIESRKGFINEVQKFRVEAVTDDSLNVHTLVTQAKELKKMLGLYIDHDQSYLFDASEAIKNLESKIAKDDGTAKIGNATLKEVMESNKGTAQYNKKLVEYWLGQAKLLSSQMDDIIKLDSKK